MIAIPLNRVQGTQGTQGSIGNGATGPTGAQGTQGTLGPTGAQGTQGTAGSRGSQGSQGTQGSIGLQGTQGSQGSIGVQGPTGATGGPPGTQGTQGSQGSIGTNFNMAPSVTTFSGVTGVVPDISNTDIVRVTWLTSGCTIYAPSGTPNDGQRLTIRLQNQTVGTTAPTSYSVTWQGGTVTGATGYTARGSLAPTLPTRAGLLGDTSVEFMYDTGMGVNKWIINTRKN
jgi:hypothetical protein